MPRNKGEVGCTGREGCIACSKTGGCLQVDGQAAQFDVGGEPLGHHIWGKQLPLLRRNVRLYYSH